jgi:hypothetical protein
MTEPTQPAFARLYAEGERLGWIFRDRNLFRQRFAEPYPTPRPIPARVVTSAARARQKMVGRMVLAGSAGFGLALLFGCCGLLVRGEHRGATFFGVLAALAFLGAAAGIGLVALYASHARELLTRAQEEQLADHQAACAEWEQRRMAFEAAEWAKVEGLLEWGTAGPPPGTRRVDVVGGSIWGWEALLTVFGGSLLSTRGPLTLVDFTGEAACRELLRLAEATGVSFDATLLPTQLAESDLLSGLDARQLVDTLIESMYGDAPTGNRAERAQDDRILTSVCAALGEDLSLGRVADALKILMGEPGPFPTLTTSEQQVIADTLFADEFKRQVHANLRHIEATIHPLLELGSRRRPPSGAQLTCMIDESEGRSARRELLKDLIVQWLIRRVSSLSLPTRSLVIAGADEISHLHIERLTDLCERRDIRLVLMFRHLRDASVQAIGGGAVAFMRLANHEEARQAAEFIGRHHKFALSQLTRTLGGNDTHSVEDTTGGSTQRGGGRGSRGWHRNWSVTRNWSQTVAKAEGTHWSDASAAQRVYEYAVEPRALQDLPDYALLLVTGQGTGSVLQAVECNPEIVLLPRVTMGPLPGLALPHPSVAVVPVSGSPTQLPVAPSTPVGAPQPLPGAGSPGWGPTTRG